MSNWFYMIAILIALGLYVMYFVLKQNKRNKTQASLQSSSNTINEEPKEEIEEVVKENGQDIVKPEPPMAFGFKCSWLAVRAKDKKKVEKALALKNGREASWPKGLDVSYDKGGELFITPAMDGWIMIIGVSLPDAEKNKDRLRNLLLKLSRTFGEAHYYGTHRVSEYQAYAKAVNGNIIRAFAYVGDKHRILWDEGNPTQFEEEIGLNFAEGDKELKYPNEESIHLISSEWSIDTFFEEKTYPAANGIIGKI